MTQIPISLAIHSLRMQLRGLMHDSKLPASIKELVLTDMLAELREDKMQELLAASAALDAQEQKGDEDADNTHQSDPERD